MVRHSSSPKKQCIAVETKPYYWLYKQGKDVWNRWMRGAFFDDQNNDDGRIDAMIVIAREQLEKSKENKKGDSIIAKYENNLQNIEDFKKLDPLSSQQKKEYLEIMRQQYTQWEHHKKPKIQLNDSGMSKVVINFPDPRGGEEINFSATIWKEKCVFAGYMIPCNLIFRNATFNDDVDFSDAIMFGKLNFTRAAFKKKVIFERMIFNQRVDYWYAIFSKSPKFNGAYFCHKVILNNATCSSNCEFRDVIFQKVPRISGVSINGVFHFIDVGWPSAKSSDDPSKDALNYSQLKREMDTQKQHELEMFFFQQELLCRAEAERKKFQWNKVETYHHDIVYGMITLYQEISRCGASILRPLFGFLALMPIMAFIYAMLAYYNQPATFGDVYYFSLYHNFPFIKVDTVHYQRLVKVISGSDQPSFWFQVIVYTHVMSATIFLFLIGLALRNRLRLR